MGQQIIVNNGPLKYIRADYVNYCLALGECASVLEPRVAAYCSVAHGVSRWNIHIQVVSFLGIIHINFILKLLF